MPAATCLLRHRVLKIPPPSLILSTRLPDPCPRTSAPAGPPLSPQKRQLTTKSRKTSRLLLLPQGAVTQLHRRNRASQTKEVLHLLVPRPRTLSRARLARWDEISSCDAKTRNWLQTGMMPRHIVTGPKSKPRWLPFPMLQLRQGNGDGTRTNDTKKHDGRRSKLISSISVSPWAEVNHCLPRARRCLSLQTGQRG